MELIEISQNLSQISKHLALLQKYISFKCGSDWTKDFKKYCDNDNQTYLDFEIEDDTVDELRNPNDSVAEDSDNIKTSMVSFQNSSTDIEIYHVKTEDLEEEEKEIFCVHFEDVEHCGGDPLANTETSVKRGTRSNVTDEDRLADLTLDIVPVLARKSTVTSVKQPNRSIRTEATSSSARSAKRRTRISPKIARYSDSSSTRTSASDYIQRGENSWECGICGNEFTLKCTLTRHLKIHRGVTIPCLDKNCTKVFTRKYYMQDHYKSVHLNLKSYECLECNESFGDKTNLNRHNEKCPFLKQKIILSPIV